MSHLHHLLLLFALIFANSAKAQECVSDIDQDLNCNGIDASDELPGSRSSLPDEC